MIRLRGNGSLLLSFFGLSLTHLPLLQDIPLLWCTAGSCSISRPRFCISSTHSLDWLLLFSTLVRFGRRFGRVSALPTAQNISTCLRNATRTIECERMSAVRCGLRNIRAAFAPPKHAATGVQIKHRQIFAHTSGNCL